MTTSLSRDLKAYKSFLETFPSTLLQQIILFTFRYGWTFFLMATHTNILMLLFGADAKHLAQMDIYTIEGETIVSSHSI